MKLRVPLTVQQLLFAGAAALLLSPATRAQQDVIVTNDNQQRMVKIIGVSPSGQTLDFSIGQGQLGLPLNSVKEVRMAPPADYTLAITAYQAKDFPKALELIKKVVAKFKGMPAPWAQQAAAMLGELYIATNELPQAETAYADFKRLYPRGGSLDSEVGLSRLAVAKQDYDTAKQKLEPITEAALKEKTVSSANANAYSQAFLVSGQVKEATGNFSGALEDYLRTVTLFYNDRVAVVAAQERADALRKAHPEITVP
jgi:outer membrane protein assembly factor BamD (BamD/ComL family)